MRRIFGAGFFRMGIFKARQWIRMGWETIGTAKGPGEDGILAHAGKGGAAEVRSV
jgi:hypothetical protein